jgi:DNA-binding CsgD family transcriptional regulator
MIQNRRVTVADLTAREVAILQGIIAEQTLGAIAYAQGVGLETIKQGAARLRAKLGVRTKAGLAAWAARRGITGAACSHS